MATDRDYGDLWAALRAQTADPSDFTHADHIGVAFEALRAHDHLEATAIVAGCLRDLAARAGAAEKFNATMTAAFMSLIAERMASNPCADAAEFIRRNADLQHRDVLAPWFSPDRLTSSLARRVALLPDRAPLGA